MTGSLSAEIAATAARLIVEDGMEYGAATRRAARDLGAPARGASLPTNDEIEEEVRAYISAFHAETQPAELAALRDIAMTWMERLAEFRPYLTGAVWRGTATGFSDIHLELYCDDSKAAELALIPMLLALLAPPIFRSANRNAPLLGVLTVLWLIDAAFLFARRGRKR